VADLSTFFTTMLRQGGYPVTPNNIAALAAWQKAEGGWTNNKASFNPLNTTRGKAYPSMNSVGVRVYPDMATGVKQTLDTLNLPYYAKIRTLLKTGKPSTSAFAQAVYSSPWGTKHGISDVAPLGAGYGTAPSTQGIGYGSQVRMPKTVPPEVLKMIGLKPSEIPKGGGIPKSLMGALPPGVKLHTPEGFMYPRLVGTATSESGNRMVQEAYKWLGTPYAWAGGGFSGPSRGVAQGANTVGFDCSSFLQYVWNKVAGVKIPRVTYSQWRAGYEPKDGLRPGDAVFFHMGKQGPGHVGMYIGNDQFIHAPHTGDVVKISRLSSYGGYVGARRYA